MSTASSADASVSAQSAGQSNLARLCQLLADFEESQPVETFTAHGWQVWPLLRIVFAHNYWAAKIEAPALAVSPAGDSWFKRQAGRVRFYLGPIFSHLGWRLAIVFGRPGPSKSCDVLVCASGQRYQKLGGRWVHYATGPFADLAERRGLKCLVWQWGRQPTPASRPSIDISTTISVRQRLRSLLRSKAIEEPQWYAAFNDFHVGHTGKRLAWESVSPTIESIGHNAGMFERWLRKGRPRLIALDCWTNWQMFSISLAAHRLNIPVVEMQHGVQEFGHSSYHWWRRGPDRGWPSMPDIFWVWGEAAAALYGTNRISQRVVVGGNPWLAEWVLARDEAVQAEIATARDSVAGYARSVLVTLGDASEELDFIGGIIAQSPANWLWLVRTHPGIPVDYSVLKAALSKPNRNVIIHEPREFPLYALLSAVDLHVTSYSTCANEALAFGKPTVLFGWQGIELFQGSIDEGVMYFAPDAETFPSVAETALAANDEKLRAAARPLFMLDEQAMQSALEDVLSVGDSQRG